jgi:hypothetical protein
MYSRPAKRRTARYALVLFSLATVIGAGTVLAAVERNDPIPVRGSIGDASAIAYVREAEPHPSYTSADCRDVMASFLNPACHPAEPRKLRAGHLSHRRATAVIGRTDAPQTEPAGGLP